MCRRHLTVVRYCVLGTSRVNPLSPDRCAGSCTRPACRGRQTERLGQMNTFDSPPSRPLLGTPHPRLVCCQRDEFAEQCIAAYASGKHVRRMIALAPPAHVHTCYTHAGSSVERTWGGPLVGEFGGGRPRVLSPQPHQDSTHTPPPSPRSPHSPPSPPSPPLPSRFDRDCMHAGGTFYLPAFGRYL